MSASKKLSTAVKALCYLSEAYPTPKNSAEIAGIIGVNSSKLRKLLSMLVKEKIIISTRGTSGGFLLNRSPEDIDLQSVYCAIEDRKAFHLDVTDTAGEIKVYNGEFNEYFLDLFSDIQIDIENKMRNISLAKILQSTGIEYEYKSKQPISTN